MKASIVIPAHNEEKIIKRTVNEVLKVMKGVGCDFEVIIVDDNSDDNTGKILDRLSKGERKIKIVHRLMSGKGPSGLGAALRYGFKNANGDVIIPFMGDLSDDPRDLPKILNKINDFDVVCGSRFSNGSTVIGYPYIKYLCNRVYNKLFSFMFGLEVSDFSNAFKGYKKSVLETVKPESNGFEITSEIVLKAKVFDCKIGEVAVNWRGRSEDEGVSKFAAFSLTDIFSGKLLVIGYHYGKLALILYLKYLLKKLSKDKVANLRERLL